MSSCIAELDNQIQITLQMDSSVELHTGSINDLQVSALPLRCSLCEHTEQTVKQMVEHFLFCSGCGATAVKQYQRYSLVPNKITQLLKEAQENQHKFLLVPVKGLQDQYLRMPTTSPISHLVLGGATLSTTPERICSYEFIVKSSHKLHLNARKFIENHLRLKEIKRDC